MITASECGHSCMTHECFSFDLFTYATLIIRPTTRSTFLWVHSNLLWQLSRDRNLHGSVMSHAKTASSKPPFRAPCLFVWNTVTLQGTLATPLSAEEMLDGLHQRVDIHVHARTAHKGLRQKRLEEDLLLNRPSGPPDGPIGQETDLN